MTRTVRQPALIRPSTGDRALDRWLEAASQRLEFLEGNALTQRDLTAVSQQSSAARQALVGSKGVVVNTGSGEAVLSFDAFAENIRGTGLYRDLSRRIDDPSRFDQLHERTKAVLLAELAPIDGKITSEIRRVEESFSSASESFAQEIATVRTSVAQAAAGVRQVRFASASENRATAGQVTQITARLNNFTGGAPGTATVESKMTAIADRTDGLEAKYTVKVTAGGAVAGFGLAATSNTAGASSAFIIQADKFAIVDSSYAGGLDTTPDLANIPFGVDADGVYVGGNLKVAGIAIITGNTYSTDVGDYSALVVNEAGARRWGVSALGGTSGAGLYGIGYYGHGVQGSASAASKYGVYGIAKAGSSAEGGVHGWSGLSAKAGVHAENNLGGLALKVTGTMEISSTAAVTNLNADMLDGNHSSAFAASSHSHVGTHVSDGTGTTYVLYGTQVAGTGVATFDGSTKPGGNSTNVWKKEVINGVTYYSPLWT